MRAEDEFLTRSLRDAGMEKWNDNYAERSERNKTEKRII